MKSQREFLFFMALVSAMSALAIDMLLPAFDEIRAAFDLPEDSNQLSLTITLFFLGSAVGFLVIGPLADALGRKRTLVLTLGLYAVAALAATVSTSLTMLLISRFVWGFASAGPRTLTQAIVRDRLSGDAMARVMALIQTAFFLGPVLAPIMGLGLVELGSWRWVMAFGVVSAVACAGWSWRLEETLAPDQRRPFQFDSVREGVRLVLSNRTTLGYALSLMFGSGAFYTFLSSSELIFDDVYDRSSLFVPFFSVSSVIMAGAALTSARAVNRVGSRYLCLFAMVGVSVSGLATLLVAMATDGVPNFWLWLTLLVIANGFHVIHFPMANSNALEPMGALAGTAAAVIGFMSSAGAALLAEVVNRNVSGTVTPLALGYVGYGLIAVGFQLWARRDPSYQPAMVA